MLLATQQEARVAKYDTEQSNYTVTVYHGDDARPAIVRHAVLTEAEATSLALRLEAMVEAEYVDWFRIEPLALPPLGTESSIYSDIAAMYGQIEWPNLSRAWEHGWRNRDSYFTRNAEAKVR
jgi:hypothetical protein